MYPIFVKDDPIHKGNELTKKVPSKESLKLWNNHKIRCESLKFKNMEQKKLCLLCGKENILTFLQWYNKCKTKLPVYKKQKEICDQILKKLEIIDQRCPETSQTKKECEENMQLFVESYELISEFNEMYHGYCSDSCYELSKTTKKTRNYF